MHQWQKFGENLSIDTGDIVETWKSGMHSVMPWPWTLTFWPQNLNSSSLSRDAPVTKVWRKSVNRYWRYRGNIKLPRESRTHARTHARTHGRRHGRTTRKHIASAGAYRRRRLKKLTYKWNAGWQAYFISGVLEQYFSIWKITVKLDIARWQLSPTSNLQREHELAGNSLTACYITKYMRNKTAITYGL